MPPNRRALAHGKCRVPQPARHFHGPHRRRRWRRNFGRPRCVAQPSSSYAQDFVTAKSYAGKRTVHEPMTGANARCPMDVWPLPSPTANRVSELYFHDLRRWAGSGGMTAVFRSRRSCDGSSTPTLPRRSTYRSTTTHGEHEAMRRFEERLGRLTPIDTEVGTPPHDGGQSDTTTDNSPRENTK